MKAVAIIPYYNILFFLELKDDWEVTKYQYLCERMRKEKIHMRDIHLWCRTQKINYWAEFYYIRTYPIKANIWNFIQYIIFLNQNK